MEWNLDEIITYLKNNYVTHYNLYHKYLTDGNEPDTNWESAVCDYIFDLLLTLTGKAPTEVADMIDDVIDKVFIFDPGDNPKNYKVEIGKDYFAWQDIYYSDYKSFLYNLGLDEEIDKDEIDDMFENIFGYNEALDEVYIPKGTRMTYKGVECDRSGRPTFYIHGEELDFAGDPFKLKPAGG